MIDDIELLRRYQDEGSNEAFADLVRRYIDLVFAVALRKVGGDAHLAQEVAQNVFTDLARKAGQLKRHPVLSAWLFKSTHFAAANLRRSEQRRGVREQQAFIMQTLLSDSTPPIDWDALRPVIDDAVSDLNDRDREAIMLRFFHGLEFPALGARVNLTAEGARARVERAVDKLRARLAQRGVTSTAAAIGLALGHGASSAAPAGLAAAVASTAIATLSAAGGIGGLALSVAAFKLPMVFAGVILATGVVVYQASRTQGQAAESGAPLALHKAASSATQINNPGDASLPPSTAPTLSSVAPALETDPAIVAGDVYLEKNPAARELLVRSHRARIAGRYFPLYLALGLDDPAATTFEEILASNGAGASYGAGMLGPERMTLRAFPKLSSSEREARLRALLGDEGYRRYQAYEATNLGPALRVAQGSYFTSTPISRAQVDAITTLFATHGKEPRTADFDVRAHWDRVFAGARGILQPAQWAPLESMRAEEVLSWMRRISAPAGNPATKSSPPAVSLETHLAQIANDPTIQLLVLANKRAELAERYGPFFVASELTNEQSGQLTEALARRIEQHDDLEEVARRQNGTRFTVVKTEHARVEVDFSVMLGAIIGDDGRARFHEYERSRVIRDYIGQLAGIAAVSGIPFTAQQADTLTHALARTSARYQSGGMATFHDIDWTAADAAAAAVLTPDQLRLFQRADVRTPRSRWHFQLNRVLRPNARPSPPEPWR